MNSPFLPPLLRPRSVFGFGFGAAALLAATALACAEADVRDDAPLSTLSASELGDLCSELRSNWPKAGETLRCDDGATVTLPPASADDCSEVMPIACSVSAGQVRACNDALLADPCGAFVRPPEACAALAGCGAQSLTPVVSDCPALNRSDIAPLEGVYERSRHTHNAASCAAEGESLLSSDSEPLFVVVGVEFLGSTLGSIRSCSDLADCRALAAEIREQSQRPEPRAADFTPSPELQQLIQCRGASEGSWRAGGASVGGDVDGTCRLTEETITITRNAEGVLRMEGRTVAWREPASNGGCGYMAGQKPTDAPCSELEVQEGRFLAPL